jgi:hypothetical protein
MFEQFSAESGTLRKLHRGGNATIAELQSAVPASFVAEQ